MGMVNTKLQLTNLFNKKSVKICALVDTGATFMPCVSPKR